MPVLGIEMKKTCSVCGRVFRAKTLDSRFCSNKCLEADKKKRKRQARRVKACEDFEKSIPDSREYLTAKEVVAIYGIERCSLYRLARTGKIPCINLGQRLIRFSKADIDQYLKRRTELMTEVVKPKRLYSLEVEDCYTIGEVSEKYHVNDSSVWAHVRKYSIPSRQIGNYVYVPKEDIDRLYTTGEV